MFQCMRWDGAVLLPFLLYIELVSTFRQIMKERDNSTNSIAPLMIVAPNIAGLNAYMNIISSMSTSNGFKELLGEMLEQSVPYQRQPKIFYDAGDQAEFRSEGAVRCEPSFALAPGKRRATQCDKLAILLHGFTSCPGMWHSLQPRLKANGFCVLRPTLPGHGYAPKPIEGATTTVTLKIDKTTWSKMNGLSEGQMFTNDEPYRFSTGLRVEACNDDSTETCYEVKDVKQGKFFEFNTLVSKFEVGGNLDMILPGDRITSVRPKEIYSVKADNDELQFSYPLYKNGDKMDANTYWNSSWSYIEIKLERQTYEEHLKDLPTSQTWPAYVSFAETLARLASAFRHEQPNGKLVMMGHSLGAVTATAAMVHAAFGQHLRVFDRVLLFNPAFGVDPSFGWALNSVAALIPFKINDEKCQRTRRTLGTGGYCKYSTEHVRAVHEFGKYAVCSLIAANSTDSLPFFCSGVAKKASQFRAASPLASDIQLVTTCGDPAIYNGRVNRARDEAVARLGKKNVGFCQLLGELGHSFLNELDITSKRDFWWTPILHTNIVNFFNDGLFFPTQHGNPLLCKVFKPK